MYKHILWWLWLAWAKLVHKKVLEAFRFKDEYTIRGTTLLIVAFQQTISLEL